MTKRIFVGTLAMALVVAALCAPTAVQSVARPALIDTPGNLRVTAASNTGITLNWNPVADVTAYQVERSDTMSGPFITIGKDLTTTTFTDSSVVTPNAYVYRARAIGIIFQTGELVHSTPSNMAVGTAISFQYSLLNDLQGKTIAAQHFYDVRTAINSVRKVAHLPAVQWSPSILNGQKVFGAHVQDLRSKLNEALAVLQIPVLGYQDPTLNTTIPIRAIHLEQLQTRSSRGSSTSAGPLYHNASRAQIGEFGPVTTLPLVAVHLSVLPDRRILFWGRDFVRDANGDIVLTPPPRLEAKQVTGQSQAYVWNMQSGEIKRVDNPTANLFCSGHSFLPDGRLFVSGGHAHPDFDALGEKQTNIFDYRDDSWTRGTDMEKGRWYPYHVTLGTGEPLIMAGSYWSNESTPTQRPVALVNLDTQIYTPALETTLPFKKLDPPPNNGALTVYPFIHLLSDGSVFQAQSGFRRVGTEDVPDQLSRWLSPATNTWGSLPSTLDPHAIGSSVFLGNNKLALIGGFATDNQPTNGVEVITAYPHSFAAWQRMAPMKFPRTYHTATMLPNGKVLVTGGVSCPGGNNIQSFDLDDTIKCSNGQVMSAELWDPATDTWTTMAAQQEIRAYHSVAALLPDGRVLVGGGGHPGAVGEMGIEGRPIVDDELRKPNAMGFGHNNVEIYSPPYLFNANGTLATRPAITSFPEVMSYGDIAFIGTSGAGSQPKVSLVRLASVTHGFNQDQRVVPLQPTLFGSGLFVTIPSSPNELPPGYYMLFVMNSAGVPSIAQMVRVQHTSLFPSATPNELTDGGTSTTWEQGIEFSSLVDGQITGIRFWKAAEEPAGGHVGKIWNVATQTQIASAQFTNETAEGWQTAFLQTPLQITAGTRYRVTYNVHRYVMKRQMALSHAVTSGPLIGYGSWFSSPAGTYPTTGSVSNLFADVIFR